MPRPVRTRKQAPAAAAPAAPADEPAPAPKSAPKAAVRKTTTLATRTRSTTATTSPEKTATPPSAPAPASARRSTRSSQSTAAAAPAPSGESPSKPAAKAPSKGKSRATAARRPAASPSPPPPPPLPKSPSRVPETPPPRENSVASTTPPSSNAENRSPPREFPSSPPVGQSTPKEAGAPGPSRGGGGGVVVDFRSDAGYTPPPPRRPNAPSAERPRLQDLEPTTLEPLPGDDDFPEPPGSPTPRAGRGREVIFEDDEDDILDYGPPSAQPTGRASGFFVPGDDEPFTIYSDPKSPIASRRASQQSLPTGTQAPPLSSSPASGRKRRSSDAGFDLESPVRGLPAATTESPNDKRRRVRNSKSSEALPTAELRSLMPRRRKNARRAARGKKDVMDVPSASSDVESESEETERDIRSEDEEEDELSRPKPRGKTTRRTRAASATSPVAKRGAAAKKTGEAWSRPLQPGPARKARTYSRKSAEGETEKEKENDERSDASSALTPVPSSEPASSVEMADGVLGKNGQRQLKALANKFRVVDEWALEFEDVSQGSAEKSSDAEKR